MKKIIVAVLLVAIIASACVFADGFKFKDLFESVQVEGGFDLFTAKSKNGTERFNNSTAGFGFDVALDLDLHSIPRFLADGWYARIDFGMFFSNSGTVTDVKIKKSDDDFKNMLGYKAHVAIMRKVDFNIPVDICFGAGYAHNMLLIVNNVDSRYTINSWGIALFATGDYKFADNFAATITINGDFTFLTKFQIKNIAESGWTSIGRQTAANFGFDLGIKAGVKYIF